MPGGIPVATVAINGALNAGLLAAKILGSFDSTLSEKISHYQNTLKETVEAKASKIEEIGYKAYLENK
jgi:5-(carboxyamino)imidazole ribonucleotide mutase